MKADSEEGGLTAGGRSGSLLELDALASEWRTITSADPYREPFYQPEWFAAFARSFIKPSDLLIVTIRNGSLLQGVLPLMRSRRFFGSIPACALRSLSNIHSNRFDFMHAGCPVDAAAKAAWEYLRDDTRWDVIEAFDVPEDGAFESLMQCADADGFLVGKWPTRKMPYLPLPNSSSDPLQNCPTRYKRARGDLKGKQKKLEKEGRLAFDSNTNPTQEALRHFFELEAAGWKGRRKSAILLNPSLVGFYTDIARAAAKNGYFRLNSLTLDGAPIATQFAFQINGSYFVPKIAYHERFHKYSPGHLLMWHVIRHLVEQGAEKLDIMGPRVPWKGMWTNHWREHANCYVFRPSLKGRLLYTATMRAAPLVRSIKYKFSGDPQAETTK